MADAVEKKMRPGEQRFIVHERKQGRNTTFMVYDRARASYPAILAGFGRVQQTAATKEEAEAEAQRLEEYYTKGGS